MYSGDSLPQNGQAASSGMTSFEQYLHGLLKDGICSWCLEADCSYAFPQPTLIRF